MTPEVAHTYEHRIGGVYECVATSLENMDRKVNYSVPISEVKSARRNGDSDGVG